MNKELIWAYLEIAFDYTLIPLGVILYSLRGAGRGIKLGYSEFKFDFEGAAMFHKKRLENARKVKNDKRIKSS